MTRSPLPYPFLRTHPRSHRTPHPRSHRTKGLTSTPTRPLLSASSHSRLAPYYRCFVTSRLPQKTFYYIVYPYCIIMFSEMFPNMFTAISTLRASHINMIRNTCIIHTYRGSRTDTPAGFFAPPSMPPPPPISYHITYVTYQTRV